MMVKYLLSVCAALHTVEAQSLDSQSLMQLSVGADGSFALGEGGTSHNSVNLASSVRVSHQLDSGIFHLTLHQHDGNSTFQLHEKHIFGNGIQELGNNDEVTLIKPSFRTFESVRGQPLALVQVNDNGHMVGYAALDGSALQLQKHHDTTDFEVSLFQDALDRDFSNLKSESQASLTPPECIAWHTKRENMNRENPGFGGRDWEGDPFTRGSDAKKQYCWKGDSHYAIMRIGILVDNKARIGNYDDYSYSGGSWETDLAHQVNQANFVYKNQFNIELEIGWGGPIVKDESRLIHPQDDIFGTQCQRQLTGGMMRAMLDVADFKSLSAHKHDVAAVQLFTGCKKEASGLIGRAWQGKLCSSGAAGVVVMNAGWHMLAHELAHTIGLGHSFHLGQYMTGGVMDYKYPGGAPGGMFDNEFQFNRGFQEKKMCDSLQKHLPKCNSQAFEITNVPSVRHSARPPPQCCDAGGAFGYPCTGKGNGVDQNMCSMEQYGCKCMRACGKCPGDSVCTRAGRPTPVPAPRRRTRRPTPAPTPAPTPRRRTRRRRATTTTTTPLAPTPVPTPAPTPASTDGSWEKSNPGKYCSQYSPLGVVTSVAECQTRARSNVSCSNVIFSNGERCSCVNNGKTCKIRSSGATPVNDVYTFKTGGITAATTVTTTAKTTTTTTRPAAPAPSTGGCKDVAGTGTIPDWQISCSDAARVAVYCTLSDVKAACKKTCGEC